MNVGALVYWSIWMAMLVVGDPLWEWTSGEQATDTHFLALYIPPALRAGILGWLIYHFMVQHLKG